VTKERKTILFLEDEQELLTTVSSLLTEHKYLVVPVKSAEEGLKIAEQSAPDLVIVDIKLPGMDGFDFVESLKKIKALAAVPVVFLTAFNDINAMVFAKNLGAADYITKPFDFEYLVARVLELAPPG